MGEKRSYTQIEMYGEEIFEMRETGQTLRQIAEHFGFKDKYVVKQFLMRERRKQRKLEAGILPRRRGRPPKVEREQTGEVEKDYEIKRLRMENQLLRDFSETRRKEVRAPLKYLVIQRHKDEYHITEMCRFFEVSRSGYYAWLKRKDFPDRDEPMGQLIQECHQKTRQTYGYRRVRLWLLREYGLLVNHKAVLRLMRKYGLLAAIRRPRPLYQRKQQFQVYENLLNRNFTAKGPNQKWVTDISYIHTGEGVLYLSCIKDLYDNFIVAYDMATTQDNALVYRTIQKAQKEVADGLILHSDQGFQYTSQGYLKLSQQYGILPSMSRPATPLDNAPAENFFGILKTECIYRQKISSFQCAKLLIDDYIHFYNYQRIQLKNGHTTFEIRSMSA